MQKEQIMSGITAIVNAFKKSDLDFQSVSKMIYEEHAVTSLEYIALLVELEKQFDVVFDDNMLVMDAVPDLHGIVDYMEQQLTAASRK
ncbi:hypothetical protein PCCS19_29970 [Paenibacillus sp. CCS19]|uniref:hypothetical protein n=1 Tax=Paenibacillus sp. CCS19 TaxID=3158387 RepID=UPI0025604878|nr:hypothetical protein [Paenibacillus cellulosilyticus]GMK39942.1 hypothetical protein PCCS19_29970 [Paenibacillus cellulosilyticus]